MRVLVTFKGHSLMKPLVHSTSLFVNLEHPEGLHFALKKYYGVHDVIVDTTPIRVTSSDSPDDIINKIKVVGMLLSK